jgi:hypothetical protein
MGKWNAGTTNPQTLDGNVQHHLTNAILEFDGDWYEGLTFNHDDSSTATTISLTAIPNKKSVQSILTTSVDGSPVDPSTGTWQAQTINGKTVFSYAVPASCLNTQKHTIHFTVNWDDGTGHDPVIIVNPTNN